MDRSWRSLVVNDYVRDDVVLAIEDAEGRVFIPVQSLMNLGIILPEDATFPYAFEDYIFLGAIPGLSHELVDAGQSVNLTVSPRSFRGQVVDASWAAYRDPERALPGAALDYDIFGSTVPSGESSVASAVGLDFFGPHGVLTHRHLVSGLGSDGGVEASRLETYYRRDYPSRAWTLQVGDATSVPGAGSRAVRYGGIQFATNFDTRPGFVTQPLPALEGEAALPTTVEVYLNESLQYRGQISEGPFLVEHIPVVSGEGQLDVVLRDVLGREQRIRQPFVASNRILRPGLKEFAVEAGAIRQGFGGSDVRYGSRFVSGMYRWGLTNRVTPELSAQVGEDVRVLGAAGGFLVPRVGTVGLAFATSDHDSSGAGRYGEARYEYSGKRMGFGGRASRASEAFTQLGLDPERSVPRREAQFSLGWYLWRGASLGVSYAEQRGFDSDDDVDIAQLNLTHSFRRYGTTSFRVVSRNDDIDRRNAVFLSHAVSLGGFGGRRYSVRGQIREQGDQIAHSVSVSTPPPLGPGVGFSATARKQQSTAGQLGLRLNTEHANYGLDVSSSNSGTAYRGGMRGTALFMGGMRAFGPRLGSGFALVEVPGQEGVQVYSRNQPVGRTNAQGRRLVTGLLPYHENRLRIEHRDLPLDLRLDTVELDAVPYFRSGVLKVFEARDVAPVLFTLVLEDGARIPAGTVLRIDDDGEGFPVGRNGRAYIEGLDQPRRLIARVGGRRCEALVSPPADRPATGTIPNLGTIVCRDV